MAEEPRVLVQVRIRAAALAEVDAIAKAEDSTRSQVLRNLLAEGLAGRKAKAEAKPGKR